VDGRDPVTGDEGQVLVVDAETPTPDQDSGSLRAVNLMRLLLEEGAHVAFYPANQRHAGRYTEHLQPLGVETWYAPVGLPRPARPPRGRAISARCPPWTSRSFKRTGR